MTMPIASTRIAKELSDLLIREIEAGTEDHDLLAALLWATVLVSDRYNLPTPVVNEIFGQTRTSMEKKP